MRGYSHVGASLFLYSHMILMRWILLLVLQISSLLALAQDNWAPVGATWYYEDQGIGFGSGYVKITSIDDSVVLGKSCRVLEIKTIFNSSSGIDTTNVQYRFTYASNDSIFVLKDSGFHLLYDFNSAVGDTWSLTSFFEVNSCCDSTGSTIVDSVGMKIINSDTLTWIYTRHLFISHLFFYHHEILERIGSLSLMFPEYDVMSCGISDCFYTRRLRCYSDSIFGSFTTNIAPSCDDVSTSIPSSEMQETRINVHPNPASKVFHIVGLPRGTVIIDLFDSIGTHLRKYSTRSKSTFTLKMGSLSPGVYIVTISSKSSVIQKKIVNH